PHAASDFGIRRADGFAIWTDYPSARVHPCGPCGLHWLMSPLSLTGNQRTVYQRTSLQRTPRGPLMATILYARVSTIEQTIEHQRTQAEKAGFKLDRIICDEGVSGVSTKLAERPQGRRLFDLLRSGDTLVVRWVDRLGRNYQDICDTIREFMCRGVVIR